jgi:hypothetical protein
MTAREIFKVRWLVAIKDGFHVSEQVMITQHDTLEEAENAPAPVERTNESARIDVIKMSIDRSVFDRIWENPDAPKYYVGI